MREIGRITEPPIEIAQRLGEKMTIDAMDWQIALYPRLRPCFASLTKRDNLLDQFIGLPAPAVTLSALPSSPGGQRQKLPPGRLSLVVDVGR
jgi:hypothetical protein